jgi:hypothetical protein
MMWTRKPQWLIYEHWRNKKSYNCIILRNTGTLLISDIKLKKEDCFEKDLIGNVEQNKMKSPSEDEVKFLPYPLDAFVVSWYWFIRIGKTEIYAIFVLERTISPQTAPTVYTSIYSCITLSKLPLLSISDYFSKRGSQVCCQLVNYVSKFGSCMGGNFATNFASSFQSSNFDCKQM